MNGFLVVGLNPFGKNVSQMGSFPQVKIKKHLKRPKTFKTTYLFSEMQQKPPNKKIRSKDFRNTDTPRCPPTLPWGLDWIRRPASTSWKICAA